MDAQTTSLDAHVLARTTQHLAGRYTGVFSRDLVERVVFESYAALGRTATGHAFLTGRAGHFATDRLAALAHAKDPAATGIPQVLFVGEHNTGRTQVAAALLAQRADNAVVVRSAGLLPGAAVAPVVLQVLAERGIDTSRAYPKPVTEDVLRAADWVITFGAPGPMPVPARASCQDWGLPDLLDDEPAGPVRAAAYQLGARVHQLWEQIRAQGSGTPTGPGPSSA